MHLLDLTLPDLPLNLALDEALLLDAEAGGAEVLRLWRWQSLAVVLGAGGRIAEDVDISVCEADGVPIARRSSGGGTVLLGPGCLCYSLVLRFDRDPALTDLHASYRFILDRILNALAPVVPGLARQGISDLTIADRKFSGNAQQRKRTHLLHHGTLLYAFDLGIMNQYLKAPPRQPAYRHGREHRAFLANLPVGAEVMKRKLQQAWDATDPRTDWPLALANDLATTKYRQESWTRRR